MYCFPMMQRTRSGDSARSGTSNAPDLPDLPALVTERLEAFFPFDPYTLPESRAFVDDIYLSWDTTKDADAEEEAEAAVLVASDSTDAESQDEQQHEGDSSDTSLHHHPSALDIPRHASWGNGPPLMDISSSMQSVHDDAWRGRGP
jgi:hypothetical protein